MARRRGRKQGGTPPLGTPVALGGAGSILPPVPPAEDPEPESQSAAEPAPEAPALPEPPPPFDATPEGDDEDRDSSPPSTDREAMMLPPQLSEEEHEARSLRSEALAKAKAKKKKPLSLPPEGRVSRFSLEPG